MPNIKRKIALFLTNHFFEGNKKCFFSLKRNLLNWCGFEIEEDAYIVGPVFITGGLKVGKSSWIGTDFSVDGNGTVIIEDHCDVAPSVHFYTGGHEIGDTNHRAGRGFNKDIMIGDGCWLCASSRYLPSVQIGNGTIVAAGAIVTGSFASNLMIGGVPAQIIRTLDTGEHVE